jgi:glycosyltransferase involved in cell wall biosynthesis
VTHPIMAELRQRCGSHPRIRVIDAAMSYPEVLSLYKSCDAFVSLHRAEGLGLALMESMALGKPVIATAWSGNMTFMNYTNACLVRYDLVPVESKIAVYSKEVTGPDVTWAAPRSRDAAAWMKRLADDRSLRERIGANAARDMRRYSDEARAGRFLDELTAVQGNLSAFDRTTPDRARVALLRQMLQDQEATTRRLRSELDWVTQQPLYRMLNVAKRLRSKVKRSLKGDGR